MFRKRKQLMERGSEEDPWEILQGVADEGLLIVRRNERYGTGSTERADLPIRIGVAVPVQTELGLSDPVLAELEDVLESASEFRARLVLVVTTPAVKEFVLHAGSGEWIAAYHQSLRAKFPSIDVQILAETDPEWTCYDDLAA